jgi:cytoskeletal protein CcmA (bactofilin family)
MQETVSQNMKFRSEPKSIEETNPITEKHETIMAINDNPILFPQETFIEGFLKTKKSIRIECKFSGSILSTQKVTVESSSVIEGDIICNDLLVSGKITGNIFCVGKIKVENDAEINGNVYTKRFENDENTNLNCVISVPNNDDISKILDILNSIDSETKLSTDSALAQIKNFFETDLTKKLSAKKTAE